MPEEYYINSRTADETHKVTKEEYQAVHKANYISAQSPEEKKQATIDYLTGIRAKTNAVLPKKVEMLKAAGKGYKDRLDSMERDIYSRDPLTELGRKQQNAMKILDSENEMIKNADNYLTKAIKGTKFSKVRVQGVSAFLTGDKETDEVLVFSWVDKKDCATVILERCIDEFLKLPLDDLDLTTDRKIARQAPVLEKMCAQYDVIVNLIAEHRDDYDDLSEEIRDKFENKIGQANGLVNYYRLMRELMTNHYYIKHENRELSFIKNKTDTPEQRHLLNLLTQTRMGLTALKCIGADALDRSITRISSLSGTVVMKEQLALQKELSEREAQMEKQSFSDYLNHLANKGNVDGINRSDARNVFDHAIKSVTSIELPERVEDGTHSIVAVLNQFELVSKLTDEKLAYQNTYYLEHNYRDITIMDEVEKLSASLGTIKDSILKIASISDKGELLTKKVSKEEKRVLQEKYSAALEEYRAIMTGIDGLRSNNHLELKADKVNDIRARGIVKPEEDVSITEKLEEYAELKKNANALPKQEISEEEAKKLTEDVKDLFLTLTENEYSDISIYRNAAKILDLSKKCRDLQGLEQKDNLNDLAELAFELRLKTRKMDVFAAMDMQNIPREELLSLSNERIGFENFSLLDTQAIREKQLEKCRETQMRLRTEAQKLKFESEDLKAEAAHYLQQDQWAHNSKKEKVEVSFITRIYAKAVVKVTRFLGWAFSRTRSKVHGAELYDSSKENLSKMPYGIKTFGDNGAGHFITHGDGKYAPEIDLNKYFKDPMKMRLAKDFKNVRELMDANVNYPQCIMDSVTALSCYNNVRGVVNNDTFEMEYAFLDKFEKSMNTLLQDEHTMAQFPRVSQRLMAAYAHLQERRNGSLAAEMTKEELEEVKKSTAIYTLRTYFGDTEESNVRNLPLFPHSPQLNDIKQGVAGNCYMAGAVQTLVEKDPEAIRRMFYDLGDGNVIVRFYAAFGEDEGKYVRIDDLNAAKKATVKPVYVKVRKHYTHGEEGSAYCLWMQLLEKAYAAAGFNKGKPDIDENGVLHNFYEEITDGEPAEVLYHLTGNTYYSYRGSDILGKGAWKQSEIEKDKKLSEVQRRVLFRQLPDHMHETLYKALSEGNKDATGFAADASWDTEYIKNTINSTMEDIRKKISGFEEKFDQLEKEGRITADEKATLASLTRTSFLTDADTFAETIIKNINNADETELPLNRLTGVDDFYTFAEKLTRIMDDKNVNFEMIESLFIVDRIIYEKIPEEEVTPEDMNKIRFSLQNLVVPNPENRYSQDELGLIRKLRDQLAVGNPASINAKSGHSMTALEINMYNGKWFVLIRDPFNSYRYEYTQNEDGTVKKEFYGLGSAMYNHRSRRELSPEMKDGFMGISWWELKDAYKQFDSLALPG